VSPIDEDCQGYMVNLARTLCAGFHRIAASKSVMAQILVEMAAIRAGLVFRSEVRGEADWA
jgi:hypothetical protein